MELHDSSKRHSPLVNLIYLRILKVVKEIDRLIGTYTDGEIADVLNERGVRTVVTTPWTAARIGRLRTIYRLADRRTRLLTQGLLIPQDVAARYGVVLSTVHLWRRRGLLRAHPIDDRGNYLYEIPEDLPAKYAHKGEYQVEPATSSPHTLRGAVWVQAFVIALARPPELLREQVVTLQLRERPRLVPCSVAQDLRHRQLRVVVQDGPRHSAEVGERPVVPL